MQSEHSYLVKAGHVGKEPQSHMIGADEVTRAALAARFGLPAIAALGGTFLLRRERGGIIAASLDMRARVTQVCVITLEPFEAVIAEQAELRFVPAGLLDEQELTPESLEGPDEIPYADDVIDLGEALAEQLALSLDPYPRKPGAALPEGTSDGAASPFAGLQGKFGKPI